MKHDIAMEHDFHIWFEYLRLKPQSSEFMCIYACTNPISVLRVNDGIALCKDYNSPSTLFQFKSNLQN